MTNKQIANLLTSAASALNHGRTSTARNKLLQAFTELASGKPIGAEVSNSDRVNWVHTALSAFALVTGQDVQADRPECVSDLLSDLMHFCDQHNLDFTEQLFRGHMHYRAEAKSGKQLSVVQHAINDALEFQQDMYDHEIAGKTKLRLDYINELRALLDFEKIADDELADQQQVECSVCGEVIDEGEFAKHKEKHSDYEPTNYFNSEGKVAKRV